MSNLSTDKTQRHFVKDGDDHYSAKRPIKRTLPGSSMPKPSHKKCECGGKLKPRGAVGCNGQTSIKCTKCSRRTYTMHYKGLLGLAECF